MFVDDQAWFTGDSIETDAPIAPDDRIYESTDTHVVGMTADGESFEYVFVGGLWTEVGVDKPVDTWTTDDFAMMEAGAPTGYGWSLGGEPSPQDDDLAGYDFGASLMSLSADDHLGLVIA